MKIELRSFFLKSGQKISSIAVLFFVFALTAGASVGPFHSTKSAHDVTLDTLRALAEKKDWPQLTNLIDQIPAALRDDEWRRLLTEGSRRLFEHVEAGTVDAETFLRAESLIVRVPEVQQDRDFMNQRGSLGVTYYESCFKKELPKETCEKMIRGFAEKDPDNKALQLSVGHIFRQPLGDRAALQFYDRALQSEADHEACDDASVKLAVINTLGTPLGKDNENLPFLRPAVRIASQVCFNHWHETLAELYAKDRVHFQNNTCHFLRDRHAITLAQGKRCPKIEWFPKKTSRR